MINRVEIRLTENERKILDNLAISQNMNLTDYVKYRLFEQNPALAQTKHIYECPANDRYRYTLLGITQQTQEMLSVILSHLKGDSARSIIDKTFLSAIAILDKTYDYKKKEAKEAPQNE